MWDDGQGRRHKDSTNMSLHIPRQIGCRNTVCFLTTKPPEDFLLSSKLREGLRCCWKFIVLCLPGLCKCRGFMKTRDLIYRGGENEDDSLDLYFYPEDGGCIFLRMVYFQTTWSHMQEKDEKIRHDDLVWI